MTEKLSRPWTSTALVLDRTTLLRIALRSPSPGGLPVLPPACPFLSFPCLLNEALAPRPGLATATLFFLTAELAPRAALVENAAVACAVIRSELCSSVPTAGLARHRRQIDPDMSRQLDYLYHACVLVPVNFQKSAASAKQNADSTLFTTFMQHPYTLASAHNRHESHVSRASRCV